MNDDDSREKKSWREIDAARDRGGVRKSSKPTSKADAFAQKKASSEAKKKLDKLFSSSPIAKDKAETLARIQLLRGRADYYEELKKYFEKFGVPMEWEAQLLFLDHRDPEIVIQVLHELIRTAPREGVGRIQVLSSKLKVMLLSTFDPRVIEKIKELQSVLITF